MPVRVIIKRKIRIDDPKKLFSLLTELRDHAQKQPGYISGETLKNTDDPQEFLVVSNWETINDWNKWVGSKERRDIQGRVDSLIGERTFYEVFEPVKH